MSNQSEPPSYDEVIKLLEPFLELAQCEHVTLNSLRTDKSLIPKIWEVGSPALLTSGGFTFVLVHPKAYAELEIRRRALVQRCVAIEMGIKSDNGPFKPAVGRRGTMPDSRLRELARIDSETHTAKRRLKENKWHLRIAKKKLSELQAERDAITKELKKEKILTSDEDNA